MLNNCHYDLIKILHDLSRLNWFLEKHALIEAQNSGDANIYKTFENLKKDLEKHLDIICKEVKIGQNLIK